MDVNNPIDANTPAPETETPPSPMEAAIATALVDTQFVSEAAAAQARQLLTARLEEVKGPDGKVVVRERDTKRPATEVVKEWLASDDESGHFRQAPKPEAPAGPASDSYAEWQREVLQVDHSTMVMGLAGLRPAVAVRATTPAPAAQPEPQSYEEWVRQALDIDNIKPGPTFGLGGRRK